MIIGGTMMTIELLPVLDILIDYTNQFKDLSVDLNDMEDSISKSLYLMKSLILESNIDKLYSRLDVLFQEMIQCDSSVRSAASLLDEDLVEALKIHLNHIRELTAMSFDTHATL
jgi:hypothetical protein